MIGRLVIEPNIRHHYSPLDFARCSYFKRNRAVIALCAIAALLSYAACGFRNPPDTVLIALAVVSQANETHRWAHLPASEVPRAVRFLQGCGLFLSPAHHRRHHTKPFDRKFCTITNFVNPILEAVKFFKVMEWLIFVVCGATPRIDDGIRPKLAAPMPAATVKAD